VNLTYTEIEIFVFCEFWEKYFAGSIMILCKQQSHIGSRRQTWWQTDSRPRPSCESTFCI